MDQRVSGSNIHNSHCQNEKRRHSKLLKRPKTGNKLGLNGNRRRHKQSSNLDLSQKIVKDLIVSLDDDEEDDDESAANKKRANMMSKIKKKIQTESKKKKNVLRYRLATLSTCFQIMHKMSQFRNNLKERVSDNEHAELLSMLPIQKRLFLQRSKNGKEWTMQKIKRRLVGIKGRLPKRQKYRKGQFLNYDNPKRIDSDSDLNALSKTERSRLSQIFFKIDANNNERIRLSELSAYYQLLTSSAGLNAANAMNDCRVRRDMM